MKHHQEKFLIIDCDNAFFNITAWSAIVNPDGSFVRGEIVAMGTPRTFTDELKPLLLNRPDLCPVCGGKWPETDCSCLLNEKLGKPNSAKHNTGEVASGKGN